MKNVKYAGVSYDCENEYRVHETIISPSELQMTFDDDEGNRTYLKARSDDGTVYRGQYGYPRYGEQKVGEAELKLFRSKSGEALLFGNWTQTARGLEGLWLIELAPIADI